jgi:hypothetical protein
MGRFRSLSVNIRNTSQRAQIIQIPKSIKRLHPAYCTIAIDDSHTMYQKPKTEQHSTSASTQRSRKHGQENGFVYTRKLWRDKACCK